MLARRARKARAKVIADHRSARRARQNADDVAQARRAKEQSGETPPE
jgi:hypothetical protein